MKKVSIVLVAVLIATMSYGEVRVNWQATGGFYFDDGFDSPLFTNLGDSTWAQLVYTVDGTREAATPGGGFFGPSVNVVWDSRLLTNTNPGDPLYTEYAAFTQAFQDNYVAGYVYARIFQKESIEAGDWYFVTAPLQLVQKGGLDFAQILEMNTDITWGNPIDSGPWAFNLDGDGLRTVDTGVLGVSTVIPEPATALMLILGGMGAWMFRRSKIKSQQEQEA